MMHTPPPFAFLALFPQVNAINLTADVVVDEVMTDDKTLAGADYHC